jgi:hypothetical protein
MKVICMLRILKLCDEGERAYQLTATCLYDSCVIGAMEKSPMEKKVYTNHSQLQLLFERFITRNPDQGVYTSPGVF